ncbi:MAG: hypothetical protein R3B72_03645 [Polyangiaceae bacterium]
MWHRWLGLSLVTLLACSGDDPGTTTGTGTGSGTPTGTSTGTGTGTSTGTSSGTATGTGTGTGSPATTLAELCGGAEVLFCDGFEGGFASDWLEDGGDVRIVAGAAVAGEGNDVLELATYQGQQSSKLIYTFPEEDEIHVRFDVQYDEAYDNSGGSHGPILGGSMNPPWGMMGTAGIKPTGADYFVLNFEPIGTVGNGGALGFYAYFVNMTTMWGTQFESTQPSPPVIVPGQWHCAEYALTLNTPGNTTDGTASFWVDGVLQGTFDGFTWRTDAALRINAFNLDSYNHFNDGAPPATSPNLVRYDNVVVSRAPVGCLAD